MSLRPAGELRSCPLELLSLGYSPKHKLQLFETTYYLTNAFQNEDIRFLVAYVVDASQKRRHEVAYPRIFYKDLSLVWRSASHIIRSEHENWIGKGDVEAFEEDGRSYIRSNEATTDLPLEIQTALEEVSRSRKRIPYDDDAPVWILHRGGDGHIRPFADFCRPRQRASREPRNRINAGRKIALFERANDPNSLRFEPGYAPDFERGLLETSHSHSRMYGGRVARFRILSENQLVQYLFLAGPRQVWIAPPQALTTEIMSYGVRTVDVAVDEDLCIPGYEYHYLDEFESPPELVTQIPEGFAGAPCPVDAYRADASPWLEKLPVVREFRRIILGSMHSPSPPHL